MGYSILSNAKPSSSMEMETMTKVERATMIIRSHEDGQVGKTQSQYLHVLNQMSKLLRNMG